MDAKIANKLLAYDSLLLMDIIRRPGDILRKALAASSNQLQLVTIFLTPNFLRDILIKVLRPSGPDSLPGGSWWQSGFGTHIRDTWTTPIQPELAGSTWPWVWWWWWWSNLEVKRTYSLPPHPVGGGCTMPPSSLAELVKRDFRYYSRILQGSVYIVLRQITSRKTERKEYLADRHPLFLLPWRRYFSAVTL